MIVAYWACLRETTESTQLLTDSAVFKDSLGEDAVRGIVLRELQKEYPDFLHKVWVKTQEKPFTEGFYMERGDY